MSETERRRYRFGPLERRGLIGSLRPTQVGIIVTSLTAAVIAMRVSTGGVGVSAAIVLVLVAVALCFWPVAGRSVEEWVPILAAHGSRKVRGRAVALSTAPQAGVRVGSNTRSAFSA